MFNKKKFSLLICNTVLISQDFPASRQLNWLLIGYLAMAWDRGGMAVNYVKFLLNKITFEVNDGMLDAKHKLCVYFSKDNLSILQKHADIKTT